MNPSHPSRTGQLLLDRRMFLGDNARALGSIALAALLQQEGLLAQDTSNTVIKNAPVIDPAKPFAPRTPHYSPKAKNVIVIFCAVRSVNSRLGITNQNSSNKMASRWLAARQSHSKAQPATSPAPSIVFVRAAKPARWSPI